MGGFNVFAYVGDTNAWVDLLGLSENSYSKKKRDIDSIVAKYGGEKIESLLKNRYIFRGKGAKKELKKQLQKYLEI